MNQKDYSEPQNDADAIKRAEDRFYHGDLVEEAERNRMSEKTRAFHDYLDDRDRAGPHYYWR